MSQEASRCILIILGSVAWCPSLVSLRLPTLLCRIFVTDADSLQALKNEVQEQDTGWVVRLRGLPFAATPEDVLAFFSGLEVLRGSAGVVFTWGRDGRPLGEAYVEFPSEAVQEEALKRDKEKMGPRYVEIFKSTKADMVMVSCHTMPRSSNWRSVPQ